MKFFPDLSFCYRPMVVRTTQTPLLSRTDDVGCDEKCNRSESDTAVAATHWRPKLSMISEDGVVVDFDTKCGQREKKSSTGRSTVKQHRFGCSKEYHRNTMRMVLPSFSPTPFMF